MVSRRILSWPLLIVLTLATPALAQSTVTTADLERLEDRIDAASRDVSQLEGRDSAAASQLRRELEDVRDDATYMKVKVRKRERVAREEYWVLRDRVDDLEARASGRRPGPSVPARESRPTATTGRASDLSEVPVGTEFDVRLERHLSSETAQVEDRFEATTLVDLRDGDHIMVPAGSTLHGVVNGVTKATRLERKGSLQVAFERLTIGDRSYPIRATVTQALESEGIRGELGRIGAGSAVGGILGAIIGGARGALIGVLIGGGGVTAATEGKDVELPSGTIFRVRLDTPLTLD